MKRIANAWKEAYAVFVLYATAIALPAQTFTTLVSFNNTDGSAPYAGLIQATNGDLYGTTENGGASPGGFGGTVFKITPGGMLTTLYSFCSQSNCTDGEAPFAGLVQATDGNSYGTTQYGGASGGGTVFKIAPSGTLTTLYSFCGQSGCTDGEFPIAGLVQATDGNFYGTTYFGGAYGGGTIFNIAPNGTLTTLYSFCSQSGCTDGQNPYAGLVQAIDGNFYGTTQYGGANVAGTIFKITSGSKLTTLYSFCSQSRCTDGANPDGGLIQATNGNFYGTTTGGGTGSGDLGGTVFKITPSGMLTTLYSFCSQSHCTDGAFPVAGLIQATDGNFYGTTEHGGANGPGSYGDGTIFKITPGNTLTTLYSFCSRSNSTNNCTDGRFPAAVLLQDTNGTFYGTTEYEGAHSDGTVFSLSVGLGPFVKTLPAFGEVGATVDILGSDLTGATSVTFNGTAAAFTVLAPSLIAATVPAGATSGEVQVALPSGTLSSNVPFRVLPSR
jgi:uncharacterized repeat protein (TIGR03803 family)